MKHAASFFRAGCLVAVACLNVGVASAQSFGTSSNILAPEQQTQSMSSQTGNQQQQQQQQQQSPVDDMPRADWNNANYGPVTSQQAPPNAEQAPVDPEMLPPFGENLFSGGFRGVMADGLNPAYTIKPGDQINLRVWGGTELQSVLTVDSQGNIFLPGIGPLNVQGISNSELNARVTSAVKTVYPENVQVYTNLQGVQPVGVFVTGYVKDPGRYSGTPSDSLLYFLDQAGGIDQALGSYRHITVKRNGQVIGNADLYDFLIDGNMPHIQFRDGDTVVVEERGPAVAVVGDVEKPFRYELADETLTGSDVVNLARLRSGVTHVLLRGDRPEGPFAKYYTLDGFRSANIRRGDEVMFSADQRSENIVVQLEGSYYGPSRYVLPRDAHLGEFLNAVGVPQSMTSYKDVSIRRESVKEQQEESLKDSLRRLEQTYLGYPSRTAKEGEIQVRQAELIERFVQKARQVEPTGRLVVARGDDIADVRLQDGDVVTIPESSDSVLLSGEVVIPQAMVYTPGMSAEDYIQQAGGFTPRADDDQVLVVHRNGAVVHAGQTQLRAGDEILVLPAAPTSNIELASSITQILYQVAVATKVALDL
ncbi:polysaccharide export protein [Salinicola corii]|uniref:Polysaccharide export protein n=1 Tax=Salinicola corii TaxID=2606937 RepID=A0A640WFH3_9GAMM|nr:polysaccharide biosynthesis/export family protein [Salinicola corii]KAA0019007.1 polysaccharide export protein [Salinicola corii]